MSNRQPIDDHFDDHANLQPPKLPHGAIRASFAVLIALGGLVALASLGQDIHDWIIAAIDGGSGEAAFLMGAIFIFIGLALIAMFVLLFTTPKRKRR